MGNVSLGVGGFFLSLGILCIVLTFLNVVQNQSWIFSWATNYVLSGIGILVGLLLIGYGIHTRRIVKEYAQRVDELTDTVEAQAREIGQREAIIREKESEVETKERLLRFTRGKLRLSKELTKRKVKQVHRLRGKLGDRSKRLKKIAELARVKKKKK